MGDGVLSSIIGWLLLLVYPLIRTLMAGIAFAINRQGSSQNLEKWIRFWLIAIAIKIVELIIPRTLIYSIVKYFIIVSLATTWSPDLLQMSSKAILWMMNEGPKLSARVTADVTSVVNGLRDGAEHYAAGAPINVNISSTRARPHAASIHAIPLLTQPGSQDTTGILAAVEARRRQLESELAALTVIGRGAADGDVTIRMPEVPVD